MANVSHLRQVITAITKRCCCSYYYYYHYDYYCYDYKYKFTFSQTKDMPAMV